MPPRDTCVNESPAPWEAPLPTGLTDIKRVIAHIITGSTIVFKRLYVVGNVKEMFTAGNTENSLGL